MIGKEKTMSDFLHRSLLAVILTAALAGGPVFFFAPEPTPPAPEVKVASEREAWVPVERRGEIEVMAFVRSRVPVEDGAVSWFFRLNRPKGLDGLCCRFVPLPGVENIEMGNPDGSRYYTGVLRARVIVETSPGFRLPASFAPGAEVPAEAPDSGPPLTEPALIVEMNVTPEGLDIVWSTANLDPSCCRVLFKLKSAGGEKSPSLFCSMEAGGA